MTETTTETPSVDASSPPDVPFALMSFYDHLDRDAEGYAADMFGLASRAWSADRGYGLSLWRTLARAYGDLVLAPYVAMARPWLDPPGAADRGEPTGRS